MAKAIQGHNYVTMAAMVLLAALLILLVALAVLSAPTTGGRGASPERHAMSADRSGGSTITQDPSIARHAEVVQRLGNGNLR